jgi:ATP-dependent Clp protease protease subunit
MISKHTGRPIEQVRNDIERDKILSAEESVEYGFVDQVISSRKATMATAAS